MSGYGYLDKISTEWYAYFGGLFTGEGCIQIESTLTATIRVEICDFAVVRAIGAHVGGKFSKVKIHGNQIQQPYRWTTHDPYLIFNIIRHIQPYVTGKKAKQLKALYNFMLLKLALQQKRLKEKRARYTPSEKLRLIQSARVVKDWSGGGNKTWKQQWTNWEGDLKKQVMHAKVS